jgi:2'-5' RNA ligase
MDSLQRMHARVEDGVVGLGFPREPRAFTAHLTLARVRDRQSGAALATVLEANQDRAVGAFSAASVGLIKSELRPAGAVYTTLVEVPFGAGV